MEERLQKYMARCGVDSRRKCEDLIARGLVEVNGEVVLEPGVRVDPRRDRVTVEGKRLRLEAPAYYIHYKTKGVTTTVSDDLGRKTVMDCTPKFKERVYPVGRLDKESSGLLVLTNDGALANYLTHPAYGVEKTYRVVAEGRVEEEVLAQLAAKGIRLGPALIKPTRVELVRYDNDNTIILISVGEGINREVRRIFAALGHEVKKLLRTQVGPLSLAGMKHGATRALTDRELKQLRKGMDGVPDVDFDVDFPPGSAAARKPTGPRGRPKRQASSRRGKPDPAVHKPAGRAGKGENKRASPSKPAPVGRGRNGGRGESDAPMFGGRRAGTPKRGDSDKTPPSREKTASPRRGDSSISSPGKGRRAIPARDELAKVVARPGKPLRPVKSAKAGPSVKDAKPAKPSKPTKKYEIGHPLAQKPAAGGFATRKAAKRK